MRKQTNPSARLVSAVQITSIRLVDVVARTRVASAEQAGKVELKLGHTGRLKEFRKEGTFTVLATMEMQLVPRKNADRPVVAIRAGFELAYALPPGFTAPRSVLTIFAKTNGIFNVWPYWRELVQSMFVRMALPPIALPVFRLSEYSIKQPARRSGDESGAHAQQDSKAIN